MDDRKKIIKLLRKAGRQEPELLYAKLLNVDLSALELAIMKHRYVEGMYFKQIPDCQDVNVSENWVFKVHKSALDKTVKSFNLADLLRLFVN